MDIVKFLNIDRSVIFFDLETTGTSIRDDRIIEIYATKIHIDGSSEDLHYLLNPTIPIPQEATAVHGITDEMIKDQPRFCDVANKINDFFRGCDLAGYNATSFDIPLLMEELHRCNLYPIGLKTTKVIDPKIIFFNKEQRTLAAAMKFYCNEEHNEAHSAKADVLATIRVLKQQLLRYDDLEPNASFLHNYVNPNEILDFKGWFIRNKEGEIIFNLGKHKGEKAINREGYLKWIIEDSDAPVDARTIAKRVLKHKEYERQQMLWLSRIKVNDDFEKLSGLYVVVKSSESLGSFTLVQEAGIITVCDSRYPDVPLLLKNKEAVDILLGLLDYKLRQINPVK
jgi:DNA polymerase-3 subunit epsilon